MPEEAKLFWCGYCGRDIFIMTEKVSNDQLICAECKAVLDTYENEYIHINFEKEEQEI
jgi:transcription initiation factor TFIIIB Brf1 subunit/transcription initiation factor TFIIB